MWIYWVNDYEGGAFTEMENCFWPDNTELLWSHLIQERISRFCSELKIIFKTTPSECLSSFLWGGVIAPDLLQFPFLWTQRGLSQGQNESSESSAIQEGSLAQWGDGSVSMRRWFSLNEEMVLSQWGDGPLLGYLWCDASNPRMRKQISQCQVRHTQKLAQGTGQSAVIK